MAWVHGTDIGVATSNDGGTTFLYRGTLDLAARWGRDTFWAPEIVWAAGEYHMYLSVIRGLPVRWQSHDRRIVHYVSDELVQWRHIGPLVLNSRRVIDACVAPLPTGTDGGPRAGVCGSRTRRTTLRPGPLTAPTWTTGASSGR